MKSKMWNLLLCIVILATMFSACKKSVNQEANAIYYNDYITHLKESYSEFYEDARYNLMDFNGDGIYELIYTIAGTDDYIMTYHNGKIFETQVGRFSRIYYLHEQNKIYVKGNSRGVFEESFFHIENGKLIRDTYGVYYDGVDENGDYIYRGFKIDENFITQEEYNQNFGEISLDEWECFGKFYSFEELVEEMEEIKNGENSAK